MTELSPIAAVLMEHLWSDRYQRTCACGWDAPGWLYRIEFYCEHVAEKILEARP